MRPDELPEPAGRSRWIRLIPVAIVVYVISFMDRTNISFAFSGMGHDLHISSAEQGLAGGIFFIGYLILQIPGGHLAERWRASASRAVPAALAGGAMGLINARGISADSRVPTSAGSCKTSAEAVSCRPRWCWPPRCCWPPR